MLSIIPRVLHTNRMENSDWINHCKHDNRPEYCPQEAFCDDEEVESIVESIEVIVESVQQGSVDFGYVGDRDMKLIRRSLEHDFPVSTESDVFGSRESIKIAIKDQSEPKSRTFTVTSSWQLLGEDSLSSAIDRTYTIELYLEGSSQYTVTELDIRPDETQSDESLHYIDRPMTSYDVIELSKLLHRIQDVELADADYVDPDSYHG